MVQFTPHTPWHFHHSVLPWCVSKASEQFSSWVWKKEREEQQRAVMVDLCFFLTWCLEQTASLVNISSCMLINLPITLLVIWFYPSGNTFDFNKHFWSFVSPFDSFVHDRYAEVNSRKRIITIGCIWVVLLPYIWLLQCRITSSQREKLNLQIKKSDLELTFKLLYFKNPG